MIKLIPLGMRTPNNQNIYTPSQIDAPKTISLADFTKYKSRKILISFASDRQNPVKMDAWAHGLSGWHLAEINNEIK